jgi:monofunctional biosynthetic peptidoglycan transglycosylase
LKDGRQVDQGAHAGGRGVQERGTRQAWAALTGWIGAAVATSRGALSQLVAAVPILARTPRPPGLRRGLDLVLPHLRRALRAVALILAALVVTVLALVVAYRWVNPPISTLMLGQMVTGTDIERTWVPLNRISPHLIRAVVLSEDGRFCAHGGVDWRALKDAIANDRGGSTITMQVVKNLFLWPSRSYVRKAIEMALAFLVDALWPKQRILEIYLNIAEWGDGVFGAEAAAQLHFAKSALQLTAREAALMVVALPNPLERSAGQPSPATSRLAGRLLLRMATSPVEVTCVRSGRLSQAKLAPERIPRQKKAERPASKGAPDDDWGHLFPGTD